MIPVESNSLNEKLNQKILQGNSQSQLISFAHDQLDLFVKATTIKFLNKK